MENDPPKNVFEASAQAGGGKKKKKAKKKGRLIASKKDKTEESPPKEAQVVSTLDDAAVDKMIGRMHDMASDINKQLETVYEKAGKTPEEAEKIFDNPKQFNPEDWKKVQEDKSELMSKVADVIGVKPSKEGTKKKKVVKKKKKKKFLGARKKWIPMQ